VKTIDTSSWREFSVIALFDRIERGKGSGAGSFIDGDVPYIAASFANNGYVRDVEDLDGSLTSDGNCIALICNGNGGIGRNTYQADAFVGSSDLQLAYHSRLNQWNGMFLVACLDKSIERYNYSFAWKRNGDAFEAETVLLPATPAGDPDWEYMEQTMREVFEQQEHDLDELIEVAASSESVVDTSNWGEFKIGELFEVTRPAPRAKLGYLEGEVPFVSTSSSNNGVSEWVDPKGENQEVGECITVNALDGTAFWQPIAFLGRGGAGSSISILRRENLNQYTGLFLAAAVTASCHASYNTMLSGTILRGVVVRLPVTPMGDPDWGYMEQTMREVMTKREAALDSLQALVCV